MASEPDVSRIVVALISGLLFGLGLTVSQMINPAKVLGFLDVAGTWDPSLALVMASALAVTAVGFAVARRQPAPLCDTRYFAPRDTQVDLRLVIGAVLFGIGWGLVGYCPGPALASLSVGSAASLIFVAAMLAGMGAFSLLQRRRSSATQRA
jgi:hypothetical protein